MLRYAFSAFILLHGFIHFMVISGKIRPSDFNEIRIIHILWLAVFAIFLLSVVSYLENSKSWWTFCLAGVVLSQSLIVADWEQARTGTGANLLLLVACIVGFSQQQFERRISSEVNDLIQASLAPTDFVTKEKIRHLPAPVRTWLIQSGMVGKQSISFVRLKQKGQMRLKPGQKNWMKTSATQHISTIQPAFVWQARIHLLPFLPITGRDKFLHGHGEMKMKIASLIPVADQADEKVDQGALQRWLAEICWYPSAALSPYMRWEAIDAVTAKATISYEGIKADMHFRFHADGDLAACYADRYMGGGPNAPLQRWEVRCLSFARFNGVRVPNRCEATWQLESGDFTWFKVQVTDIEYNNPHASRVGGP